MIRIFKMSLPAARQVAATCFTLSLLPVVLHGGVIYGDPRQEPVSGERTEVGQGLVIDGSRELDAIEAETSFGAIKLRGLSGKGVASFDNSLTFESATEVSLEQAPRQLIESIKKSSELSLEAWFRTAGNDQTGPARMVTLSKDSSDRNITLGQDGGKLEVRLRTTSTSSNGVPSLATPAVLQPGRWTHVVYTYDKDGLARIYVDGKKHAQQHLGGNLSNWSEDYRLAIGNELSGDRPWRGALAMVAIYNRALDGSEVRGNFQAGRPSEIPSAEKIAQQQLVANRLVFEREVAPILSNHCLECHDTLNRAGGLDLSDRETAFTLDGHSIIAPGAVADSQLWLSIEDDSMPHDRELLSIAEKESIKQWIEGGANWTLPRIDPVIYLTSTGTPTTYVRRLTVAEYVESVRATLDVDIQGEAERMLPTDLRADGFSNTAYNLQVDLAHVEAYAKLAELATADLPWAELVRKFTKNRELTDENLIKFIKPFGERLLRGPLTDREVALYCGVGSTVAAAGGDIDEAARFVVEAMLQSARFLYRIESQLGSGRRRPVDSIELATRLSFLVWGAPPDERLLDSAKQDQLDSEEIVKQVERMLKDPRAVEQSLRFVEDWLGLRRLDNMNPSPEKFPDWNRELASEMRQETRLFFKEVIWNQRRPLGDLLNARVTFVTPRLAGHYGMDLAKLDTDLARPQKVEFNDEEVWGGLLTQGSTLTIGGEEASMVTRGLFLMNELLRGVVRNPPPGIDTSPTPSRPGLTQRKVAEMRIANESCVGCHAKFDPLAYGLEKFDGLGRYREQDEFGNTLREDGEILIPGTGTPIAFESVRELMDLLASSDRVQEALTWKLAQFAAGRPLGAEDAADLSKIHNTAQQSGGTYMDLIKAISISDLVTKTHTETLE